MTNLLKYSTRVNFNKTLPYKILSNLKVKTKRMKSWVKIVPPRGVVNGSISVTRKLKTHPDREGTINLLNRRCATIVVFSHFKRSSIFWETVIVSLVSKHRTVGCENSPRPHKMVKHIQDWLIATGWNFLLANVQCI